MHFVVFISNNGDMRACAASTIAKEMTVMAFQLVCVCVCIAHICMMHSIATAERTTSNASRFPPG